VDIVHHRTAVVFNFILDGCERFGIVLKVRADLGVVVQARDLGPSGPGAYGYDRGIELGSYMQQIRLITIMLVKLQGSSVEVGL
jgi:hypothetical protein